MLTRAAAGVTWRDCWWAWWRSKRESFTKSERQSMRESPRQQELAPSFISLVKILSGFNFPATWMIFRVLSCTHSWMEFLRSSVWQATFENTMCNHLTQALLSLYKSVGEEKPSMEWPLLKTLQKRILKSRTFFDVPLVAQISVWQKLRDIHSLCSPSQQIGPPFFKMMPPFILQNLKRGRRPNMHCCKWGGFEL